MNTPTIAVGLDIGTTKIAVLVGQLDSYRKLEILGYGTAPSLGVQRGVVVIPKSVTPARIASNFAVFDFKLDEEDLAALAKLDRGHRLVKGLPWLREGETWEALWDTDFLA
jgi:hypothetical protein